MHLFYRDLGRGNPVVILHGLYGSSDNWMTIGRELSENYRVILVDQRNHGQSPHSPQHSYKDLVNDLLELFNDLNLPRAFVVGHSMGGKVAMLFTSYNPDRVAGLAVIDILPFSYGENQASLLNHEQEHRNILAALLLLRPELAKTREELDDALKQNICNSAIRRFLMKNLKRNDAGGFRWTLNVVALSHSLPNLMGSIFNSGQVPIIKTPTLFIKGEQSDYFYPQGEGKLKDYFLSFEVKEVSKAGHWLHAENPDELLTYLKKFFLSVS